MIHKLSVLAVIKMPCISIIAFFLLFTLKAHTQSVKLLQGSAFEVALTEENDNFIKTPITVTADSGTITLRLVNVTLDNPARTIPNSAFEARIETDDLHNEFLQIIIHNRHPLDQGKYHLLFNLIKTKPVAHPETFTLDLTVKSATLSPVGNQVALRIQNIPFGPFTPVYKPLTIFETSRNALVFPVTIRQLALTDTKGAEVSSASITFKDTDLRVKAGRQAHFPYQVQGDLPIGTVSGSFEISAPQLAAPVVFKLDIITKRSGWWIIFLILAGLLFGYGTRIALDEILKVNRARKELIEFSQQLDEEKINKPDVIFCRAVDVMLQKLNGAKKKNVSDINAAIAAARTDLAAALTELNMRQVALQTKLKAFADAFTGVWNLPEGIKNVVATTTDGVKKVNAAIITNNSATGDSTLDAINMTLANDLVTETAKLKNTLKAAYESMRQSPLKIMPAGSALLQTVNELEQSAAAIPDDQFEKTPENIRALLQAVTTHRRKAAAMFFDVLLTVKSLVDTLADLLTNGNVDLRNELLEIRKKSDTKFNVQSDKALDDALAHVETDMNELQQDILAALTAEKLGLNTTQVKTISDNVRAGRYTDAANSLVEFKRPAIINEGALQTTTNGTESSSRPLPSFQFASQTGDAPHLPLLASPAYDLADISTGGIRYAQILRTIFLTSLLQTLLIGVGIAIFGYPLFVEKFTGTVTDMIEIFSWAFVMDVSINSLTTVSSGVPKHIRS